MQNHLPRCTKVLLGMGFFSYNPVQSLQGVISVFHICKIQSPPFSVASIGRYLSTLNARKMNNMGILKNMIDYHVFKNTLKLIMPYKS